MIGLIIHLNKYDKYFYQETITFNEKTIEDIKNKLLSTLVDKFNFLHIDYPLLLSEFEYIWFQNFNDIPNDLLIFEYNIYDGNNWIKPWDDQDIYTEVLDRLHNIELSNIPNFEELYGEPTPEYNEDNSYIDSKPDYYNELETIFKNIIDKS